MLKYRIKEVSGKFIPQQRWLWRWWDITELDLNTFEEAKAFIEKDKDSYNVTYHSYS